MKAHLRMNSRGAKRFVGSAVDRTLSIFVFLFPFLVYAMTLRTFIGGDSPSTAYLPAAILRHHTLRLDPYVGCDPLFNLENSPHWVVESGGHYYSKFSPVTGILAVPFYAGLFLAFGPSPECMGVDVWASPYLVWSLLVSITLSLATLWVLFRTLRKLLSSAWGALGLTLAYAMGTWTWQSATSTLTTQSTAELFVALALAVLVEFGGSLAPPSDPGRLARRFLFLFGLYSGLAVAARPQVLPAVGAFGLYLWLHWQDRRITWCSAALGFLLPLSLLAAYQTWAFGAPWRTGYGMEALAGWQRPALWRLAGILVSPAHGLLIYSPLFLFSVFGGYLAWRSSPVASHQESAWLAVLGRGLSLASAVQILVMSCWWAWHGGIAYNQRMLQEIHPYLLFLVALAVRRYGHRHWLRVGLWMAVLWGSFLNMASKAFYEQHLPWLERPQPQIAWSWGNMEPWMYVHWHGLGPFLLGVLGIMMRVLVGFLTSIMVAVIVVSVGTWLRTNEACRTGDAQPLMAEREDELG